MQIFGESYFAPPSFQENLDDMILEQQEDELSDRPKVDGGAFKS